MTPDLARSAALAACALLLPSPLHASAPGDKDNETATPKADELAPAALIARGANWILEHQEALADSGEPNAWPYEGVYRVRGEIPLGYRVGGTAIAYLALIESPALDGEEEAALRAAVGRGIDFVVGFLDEASDLRVGAKSGYDVRGWGFTYALALAVRGHDHERIDAERQAALKGLVPTLMKRLKANQEQAGGWNYAGRGMSPFQTGATLLELFDARAAGFEVDEALVTSALDALEKGRTEAISSPGWLRST